MKQDLKFPYAAQSIDAEDVQEVAKSLSSPVITRGQNVQDFEEAVAKFCQVEYAICFSSGTAALQAAYFSAKLSSYDRVITSPNTYIATASMALHYGAKPLLMDIEDDTGNMDLRLVEKKMKSPSTRGRYVIVPVHYSGIAVDMRALDRCISYPDTMVIEDAAHAFGSKYRDGTPVGSCRWSDMTIFSFHPAKNLTTAEGGMVTCNDQHIAHLLRRFRNNGIEKDPAYLKEKDSSAPWYYDVLDASGNFHLTEMQAALGLSQLKKMRRFVEKRRRIIGWYREYLKDLKHVEMSSSEHDPHTAYHLCVLKVDFEAVGKRRQECMEALRSCGIGTQVHYIPLYYHTLMQPYFYNSQNFPNMEAFYQKALSMPMYYDLKEKNVEYICEQLKRILK